MTAKQKFKTPFPHAGPGVELARRPPPPYCAVSRKLANRGPPVCRGWIPESRRRGSWRLRALRGSPSVSTRLFGLRFGVNVKAVWARHGQSAAMPCLRFFSSFKPFQCHNVQSSSINHSFSYISEGGGLRVNQRACILLFFFGCLEEGDNWRGVND